MHRHSRLHAKACAEIKNWQHQPCHDMQLSMPWHAKLKKTGSVEDATARRTGCRNIVDSFDLFALWGKKHDFKSGI